MTAPLTPSDCDLRGLPYMPLHGERLIESDLFFLSTGDEFKAAVALWWASWKQVPAASLPDNPRILAGLARVSDAKRWAKISETALRGWIKCDDGRLYHPVVAEVALQAWEERVEHRQTKDADTDRKRREREERKALFAALKVVGVHLPWNTSLSDLRTKATDLGLPVTNLSGGQVVGRPADVPCIEGKVEVEGTSREIGSNDPLSPGKPGRARSLVSTGGKEPIPDGFPGPTDIGHAESLIAAAGVVLSAAEHAKRFRSYAKTHKRCVADWFEAWVGWIETEIRKAPAAAVKVELPPAKPWAGPADVRKAFVAAKSEEWTRAYIDPAGWQDVPERALIPATGTAARKILAEARGVLATEKLQLLEKAA